MSRQTAPASVCGAASETPQRRGRPARGAKLADQHRPGITLGHAWWFPSFSQGDYVDGSFERSGAPPRFVRTLFMTGKPRRSKRAQRGASPRLRPDLNGTFYTRTELSGSIAIVLGPPAKPELLAIRVGLWRSLEEPKVCQRSRGRLLLRLLPPQEQMRARWHFRARSEEPCRRPNPMSPFPPRRRT
jgi:hypothetical protein